MKKLVLMVLALILVFAFAAAPAVQAAEEPAAAKDSWIMLPMMKLGRGIANVAFGALELPIQWYEVQNEYGGIAGITYGTLKGLCYVVAREVVGVVEIVTFPFPLPNCPDEPFGFGAGYGPIMQPEWIIDAGHNWGNFVYSREAIITNPY